MTELDTDARTTGNAAISALRSALEDAEFRERKFAEELDQAEAHLGKAQFEVAQLKEAIMRLQGGDGHGG